MIKPIAKAICEQGGSIRENAEVQSLLVEDGRVRGVRLQQEDLLADAVVLAVPLKLAQRLIREPFGKHDWFQPMLRLPSLSAATIQFELTEPMLDSDRTNFSSTGICCFAEQSRTTFTQVPGRFSAILYPPEQFIHLAPDQVLERVYRDAESIGLPLRESATGYRIVNHAHDFYAMEPGTEALRPSQRTPVSGLALAGDYTKQPFVASMEGAVLSGQYAAAALQ
jgi:15-cis-phytoene desaturase